MLRKKSRFVSNGVLFVAVQMKVVTPLRWPDYANKEIKSSKLLLPTLSNHHAVSGWMMIGTEL